MEKLSPKDPKGGKKQGATKQIKSSGGRGEGNARQEHLQLNWKKGQNEDKDRGNTQISDRARECETINGQNRT